MSAPLSCSDKRLALQAAAGNDVAFGELARRAEPMLRAEMRGYFLPGGDVDDLHQAALCGLYSACLAYDGQRPFGPLARTCVHRAIVDALKMAKAKKHTVLNTSARLESPAAAGDSTLTLADVIADPRDHEERQHARAQLRVLARALPTALSQTESRVLARVLDGATLAQAGADLAGGGAKVADNAMQRTRRKAREVLRDAA